MFRTNCDSYIYLITVNGNVILKRVLLIFMFHKDKQATVF